MLVVPLELVPDPDDPRLASCFVRLGLNGHASRALLDTGARRSAFGQRPGLHTWQAPRSGGGLFGGGPSTETRALVSVELAGVTLSGLEVTITPADHPGPRDLLGQDVLGRYCCEYRLGAGQVRVGVTSPREGEAVWVGRGRHVVIAVTWSDGTVARGLFDTGASITIVDRAFAEQHPRLVAEEGTSTGTDAGGASRQTPIVRLTPLAILGSEFPASTAALVDLTHVNATLEQPIDLILGWPLLRHGSFVIDTPAGLAAHQHQTGSPGRQGRRGGVATGGEPPQGGCCPARTWVGQQGHEAWTDGS